MLCRRSAASPLAPKLRHSQLRTRLVPNIHARSASQSFLVRRPPAPKCANSRSLFVQTGDLVPRPRASPRRANRSGHAFDHRSAARRETSGCSTAIESGRPPRREGARPRSPRRSRSAPTRMVAPFSPPRAASAEGGTRSGRPYSSGYGETGGAVNRLLPRFRALVQSPWLPPPGSRSCAGASVFHARKAPARRALHPRGPVRRLRGRGGGTPWRDANKPGTCTAGS